VVCCSILHENPYAGLRTLFLYTVSYWPNQSILSIDTHYCCFQVGIRSEKATGNMSKHRELTALYRHNSLLHTTVGSRLDVPSFPCQFLRPECIHILSYSVTKQVVGRRWNVQFKDWGHDNEIPGQGYHTHHGMVRRKYAAMLRNGDSMRKLEKLEKNSIPLPLHPPWILNKVIWDRTQDSTVRSQHVTAWAMAQLIHTLQLVKRIPCIF
jgi:hypothetical protein